MMAYNALDEIRQSEPGHHKRSARSDAAQGVAGV